MNAAKEGVIEGMPGIDRSCVKTRRRGPQDRTKSKSSSASLARPEHVPGEVWERLLGTSEYLLAAVIVDAVSRRPRCVRARSSPDRELFGRFIVHPNISNPVTRHLGGSLVLHCLWFVSSWRWNKVLRSHDIIQEGVPVALVELTSSGCIQAVTVGKHSGIVTPWGWVVLHAPDRFIDHARDLRLADLGGGKLVEATWSCLVSSRSRQAVSLQVQAS